MKTSSSTRLATMIAAIAIASLAATWAVGRVVSDYEQASKDREASARLTDKMKTVCVGRFLLDMPNDAQIDLGSATIDGIDLALSKKQGRSSTSGSPIGKRRSVPRQTGSAETRTWSRQVQCRWTPGWSARSLCTAEL